MKLSPDNRHVLRSAACYYIHINDAEQANDVLKRASATAFDPWLKSAEIATAAAAERTSRNIKQAKDDVKRREYSDKDITELASAIATVELANGNATQSKKFFRASMADPTENAVAQAEWTVRNKKLYLEVSTANLAKPRAFEAIAIAAYARKRWAECTEALRYWMVDQPFSIQPALIGSVVASDLLLDELQAIEFTKQGLRGNPFSPLLHNNEAVAFARLNRLQDAQASLARAIMHADKADVDVQIVLTATRGLLAFRSKDAESGRTLYEQAINLALKSKRPRVASRAYIYYLQEEAFFDPENAISALKALEPLERLGAEEEALRWLIDAVKARISPLAQVSSYFSQNRASVIDSPCDIARQNYGQKLGPEML